MTRNIALISTLQLHSALLYFDAFVTKLNEKLTQDEQILQLENYLKDSAWHQGCMWIWLWVTTQVQKIEHIFFVLNQILWCNYMQQPVRWHWSFSLMSILCEQSTHSGSIISRLSESRPQVKGVPAARWKLCLRPSFHLCILLSYRVTTNRLQGTLHSNYTRRSILFPWCPL